MQPRNLLSQGESGAPPGQLLGHRLLGCGVVLWVLGSRFAVHGWQLAVSGCWFVLVLVLESAVAEPSSTVRSL